jgi:hypothetical protein
MISRRNLIGLSLAAIVDRLTPAFGADTTARLLFVHGRGQAGLKTADLQSAWLSALVKGAQALGKELPANLEVAFPYYGDVLDDFVKRANLPLTSEVITRGGQPNDNFLAFQADVAQALRVQAGVTDDQVLSEYGNNPKPRGPLNWEWVHAIFRAIDQYGGGLSSDVIEQFTRDVYLYTTVQTVRDAVDAIVRAQLNEKRTIVVAHSLGTVVAYNVLRADTRALSVPLLTTVGSPLGIRAIRDQLLPLSFPAHVQAWYNAYDPRDVVALYPLDSDNFAVTPAIENDQAVTNETDDRHGISGYLSDKHVVEKLLSALKF